MGITPARSWIVLSLLLFGGGCGQHPHFRLGSLVGTQIYQHQEANPSWPQLQRIGLVVHSDTTAPGAAPSISKSFRETLSRRTEAFLTRRCRVSSAVPIAFPASTAQAAIQQEFILRGQELGISHLLLVVLSSRENSSPVTLGEETIMTQMSGTLIENLALAEVVVLRLSDYQGLIALSAGATEELQLLDAPLGEGALSRDESLNILRAQAAQQALDRSFQALGQWCEGIPERDLT